MADEITQKHLDKLRIRGVPATLPGSAGMVDSYPMKELHKQTTRALSLDLEADFSIATVRSGQQTLAQAAAAQGLRTIEQPLLALNSDPVEDVPLEWKWQLLLPARGPAKTDEDKGIGLTRMHGGSYIQTMTHGGLGDLPNLYTYFLGYFLPARKQQLTRPVIYHRIVDGIENDDANALTLHIFIPIQLSLKQPLRLVTREEI